MTPDALLVRARAHFKNAFGYAPQLGAVAPGRVNLIGDHTDYSHGFALPCAIDLYTVAVAAPRPMGSHSSRLISELSGSAVLELPLVPASSRAGDWGDYLRGVHWGFAQCGVTAPPMDIAISGNLPIGAGLSSSASLELCYASLLELAAKTQLDLKDKALLCQRAEHDFAGVPCGILDQFAIAFGRAGHGLILDCRAQTVSYTPLPQDVSFVIIDSGVGHDLADGEYAARREQVLAASAAIGGTLRDSTADDLARIHEPLLRRRAAHVIGENIRVHAFAAALTAGDWQRAGDLMQQSHASLSNDFAVSCPQLDWLAVRAVECGAYGARMTGGGFGGSVVCLCEPGDIAALLELAEQEYPAHFANTAVARQIQAVDGAHALLLES